MNDDLGVYEQQLYGVTIHPSPGHKVGREEQLRQDVRRMRDALFAIVQKGQTPHGMTEIGRLALAALDGLSEEGKRA